MEVPLKIVHKLLKLTLIAQKIHEEAIPLETLDSPKNYEVSASHIQALGNALQSLRRT